MAHEITWLGHSAFRIVTSEPDSKVVLIDPFLDGNPTASAGSASMDRVDVILVTHDHADHTGQVVEIATRTGAMVVGVYDTLQVLIGRGLPQEQSVGMNIGGTVQLAGIKAKMVQAMHSSASGVAAGYIVTLADGFCLYHAGDTGLFASMELFARFHRIDLALLPIGGHFTMDPEQAAYACKLLAAAQVIPMHWGTFPVLEQNTSAFAEQLSRLAPDTRLHSLAPGQTFTASPRAGGFDCGCD